MKNIHFLIFLIPIIYHLSEGRQYNGNFTCNKCVSIKCSNSNCIFVNGGPFKDAQMGCYQNSQSSCSNYFKPFKVYECSQCSDTCCYASPGDPVSCVNIDAKQGVCVFDNKQDNQKLTRQLQLRRSII